MSCRPRSASQYVAEFFRVWFVCTRVVGGGIPGEQNVTNAVARKHEGHVGGEPVSTISVTNSTRGLMRREELGKHKLLDNHEVTQGATAPVASLIELWPHREKRRRSSWSGNGDASPRSLLSTRGRLRNENHEECPGTKVSHCGIVMPPNERHCRKYYTLDDNEYVICGIEYTYSTSHGRDVWTGRCYNIKESKLCIEVRS
eukprot:TRINITY_DN74775_c0_g1_i1.p1 TRINITY_DN74775_c0_g1~~TRINITY_DN74775_c0_g1_i1.p1  ORF type:complete len:201 (-),score=25.42 TRINITY_DN74775_c0_g1_i1:61-663(-)